ncbi:hypothetical protein [Nannocystis bainbridge]|uniref:Uncharacterized protein n=1 Tax=Nannocystis bainbridge TaxID=2995303 RepID=A0ABT5DT68_9BACT|nr:hypothetical protein [Nannocystis bainbridge]MDC0716779.1 hypothetical protein [Nannocystis bainbridge]
MARSYKRHPVVAVTTASSEKQDRLRDSRCRRRKLRAALKSSSCEPPVEPRRSGSAVFAKDGKRWLAADASPLRRLRK